MTDFSVRPYNEGLARSADALLRSMGGFTVGLRFPLDAAIGSDREQLGLGSPRFQDLPLAPAVFRKLHATYGKEGSLSRSELLISANAVKAAVSSQEVASADILFALASGIVINGVLFLIEADSFSVWQGNVFLYRALLRESPPDAVAETIS